MFCKGFTPLQHAISARLPADLVSSIVKSRPEALTQQDIDVSEDIDYRFQTNDFEKGFDYMVCGHYHLNELIDAGKGKLAVLGDWQDQPSYAVFDGKELTLHQWENDD